jgi:hypothetical protein
MLTLFILEMKVVDLKKHTTRLRLVELEKGKLDFSFENVKINVAKYNYIKYLTVLIASQRA